MTDMMDPLDYLSATHDAALEEASTGVDSMWHQRQVAEACTVAGDFLPFLAAADSVGDYEERKMLSTASLTERLSLRFSEAEVPELVQAGLAYLDSRVKPAVEARTAARVAQATTDAAAASLRAQMLIQAATAHRAAFNASLRTAMDTSLHEQGFTDAVEGSVDSSVEIGSYRQGVREAEALLAQGAKPGKVGDRILATAGPLDRSVIFTSLLTYPEFGALTSQEGSVIISDVLEDWEFAISTGATDMHKFVQSWVDTHGLPASPKFPMGLPPADHMRMGAKTAGEQVTVQSLPDCDICKYVEGNPGVEAHYDGKTISGPWANMCEAHFASQGVGLGTGRGQRLVVEAAKSNVCPKCSSHMDNVVVNGNTMTAKCDSCGWSGTKTKKASHTADRTGPTIDSAEGYEYQPAPEEVAKIMRARFEGGGATAIHPDKPGYYLHGVGNWWDGPHEVKDNGDGSYSFTNPYTNETDRFDASGYWDAEGNHHQRTYSKTSSYENPTTNCLLIMKMQSDAYDKFDINGFSGDPNDPSRLKVIEYIKDAIKAKGLALTMEDVDSLEDNNAHAGAEAAMQAMGKDIYSSRRTAADATPVDLHGTDLRQVEVSTLKPGDVLVTPMGGAMYQTGPLKDGTGEGVQFLYGFPQGLEFTVVSNDGSTLVATDSAGNERSQEFSSGRKVLVKKQGTKTAGWAIHTPEGKPLWGKTFDTEDEARAHFDKVKSRTDDLVPKDIASYEVKKTAMPSPDAAGIKVGDIYVNSWGYDQTNVDFYEVTRLMGASVALRQIGKGFDGGRSDGPHDHVVPMPGKFVGPEITKRIPASGKWLNLNSYSGLSPWDGTPQYQTGYGYGH